MVRIAVIVLGVLLSFAANAQSLRLKDFLHPENERMRVFNEIYLAGAMDALTAYNMAAPVKLFCKEGDVVSHEEAAQLLSGLGREADEDARRHDHRRSAASSSEKDLSLSLATTSVPGSFQACLWVHGLVSGEAALNFCDLNIVMRHERRLPFFLR